MPIYKDSNVKKNPWYYAFETKDINNKRKTIKKRGFRTKKDAELAEAEVKTAMNLGVYIQPSNLLFGDYIKNWLDNKKDLTEQSRYNNESILRLHILPHIGNVKLSDLNVNIIENFVKELESKNLAGSSVRKIFNLVSTSLKAAVKKQIIFKSPIDLLDTKPKINKSKIDYWTREEVKQFLNGFEHRQKTVFVIAIYTGMRIGEILGLRINDIDWQNNKIHIRQVLTFRSKLKVGAKTNSGNRSISVPKSVMISLKKHKNLTLEEKLEVGEEYQDNGLLICTKKGTPFSSQNARKLWWRLLGKTGVRKIRIHDLRHTCASLLFQTNPPANPKVVQELLGHSSIKITYDVYSHLIPNMHEEALNNLDDLLSD